ncbi:hypothetical protein AWW66_09795 [Micromonospora rosaria]|uniref:Uncharacterized protein n=1 Tax=Micromonospora rosaria TaxID=47874 RepID=A0A136PV26_9ACTN|nr:hypothetical protein AWW66_09795 [Micromonospora rosaria]
MDIRRTVNEPTRSAGPYSRFQMRALAVTSAVLSVVIIVWGLILAAQGDSRGGKAVAIGVAVVLVLVVAIPYGVRKGRL